ncbi:MAG: glycerol-3-phosphate acyltransferase [Caldisericaceae bacterium]
MDKNLWIWLLFLFSYFIGAVPNGFIITRYFYHFDVQKRGSGNIGATNIFVTLGFTPALVTFLLDALVGAAPALIAKSLYQSIYIIAFAGAIAVFGHNYSIFMKGFKGGRGVATAFGAGLVIAPKVTLICLAIFVLLLLFSRHVAVGSIFSIASSPLLALLLYKDVYLSLIITIFPVLVIISHAKNIKHLIDGTEMRVEKQVIKRKE